MFGRGIAKALIVVSALGLAACADDEPMEPAPVAAAPAPTWQAVSPNQLVGRTIYLESGEAITLGSDGRFMGQGKGGAPAGRYAVQGNQICFETVAGNFRSGCYAVETLEGRGRLSGPSGTIGFDA